MIHLSHTMACPLIDSETQVEISRQWNKGYLLLHLTGGPLPGLESAHCECAQTILDIGCGTGSWSLEMARTYPEKQIIGIDRSFGLLNYAYEQSIEQCLSNVSFLQVPHFLEIGAFPDASFDIIAVSFLSLSLYPYEWLPILTTCWRLLRPGGSIRIIETDVASTNAPACEELITLFLRAMKQTGRSLSDRHLEILCELEPLLHQCGFHQTRVLSYSVNFSFGADLYLEWSQDYLLFSRALLPFLERTRVASQAHITCLLQQQHKEMLSPTFHALQQVVSIWGVKDP